MDLWALQGEKVLYLSLGPDSDEGETVWMYERVCKTAAGLRLYGYQLFERWPAYWQIWKQHVDKDP